MLSFNRYAINSMFLYYSYFPVWPADKNVGRILTTCEKHTYTVHTRSRLQPNRYEEKKRIKAAGLKSKMQCYAFDAISVDIKSNWLFILYQNLSAKRRWNLNASLSPISFEITTHSIQVLIFLYRCQGGKLQVNTWRNVAYFAYLCRSRS